MAGEDCTKSAEKLKLEHGGYVLELLDKDRKNEHRFCDVILRTEESDFYAHKCVVGLMSDFFGSMLKSEMLERYANVVPLQHTSPLRLTIILDFIYTGVVKLSDVSVYDVLQDADYMQLHALIVLCEIFLVGNTSRDNCLKNRLFSQRFRLKKALEKSNNVIKSNVMYVLRHDEFLQLECDDVKDIVKTCEIPQDALYNAITRWVKYDEDKRKKYFSQLFPEMKLGLLPKSFIKNVVAKENLVSSSSDCLQTLLQVLLEENKKHHNPGSFVMIGGVERGRECVQFDHKFQPSNLPKLNDVRIGCVAFIDYPHLYVAGGGSTSSFKTDPSKSAEMYDFGAPTGGWKFMANMNEERMYAAGCIIHGYIYVTGGGNKSGYLRSCERYDVIMEKWNILADMKENRAFHGTANYKDTIYSIGGCNELNHLLSVEKYHYVTDTWSDVSPMFVGRSGLVAIVFENMIYAIGGFSGKILPTVERYNPETDTWTQIASLNAPRNRPTACVLGGKIYVIGGQDGSRNNLTSIEVYSHQDDTWTVCSESIDHPRFSSAMISM